MTRLIPLFVLAAATAAPGQAQAPAADPPEKIRQLVVYGNDPCPRGEGGEIVVCARRPNSERYRIPPGLRDEDAGAAGESWAARAASIEYVGRTGIQSCSTTGPGGATGCLQELIDGARKDRTIHPENLPK